MLQQCCYGINAWTGSLCTRKVVQRPASSRSPSHSTKMTTPMSVPCTSNCNTGYLDESCSFSRKVTVGAPAPPPTASQQVLQPGVLQPRIVTTRKGCPCLFVLAEDATAAPDRPRNSDAVFVTVDAQPPEHSRSRTLLPKALLLRQAGHREAVASTPSICGFVNCGISSFCFAVVKLSNTCCGPSGCDDRLACTSQLRLHSSWHHSKMNASIQCLFCISRTSVGM